MSICLASRPMRIRGSRRSTAGPPPSGTARACTRARDRPRGRRLPAARRDRRAGKRGLLAALAEAGLLPHGVDPGAAEATALTPELAAAFHRFLARSEARLFMVQIDDLASEAAQINMPGTTGSYPNWQRRLSLPIAQIAAGPAGSAILEAVRAERPQKRQPL